MAIELTFYMNAPVSSSELLAGAREVLASHAGSGSGLDSDLDSNSGSGSGSGLDSRAGVDACEAHIGALGNEIRREALGFEATCGLRFRLHKRSSMSQQILAILDATLRLLERQAGDAALLFDGEIVYFVRREGVLAINTTDETDARWSPDRISLLRGPYIRRAFDVI
ncbi:SitI3 family protein [Pendulispora albinea]|uniref:Uncharacterized protein n=1 Tax=Pendulispora albinea TaxID=2741071 RepID=A0ABZ2M798_9BACT